MLRGETGEISYYLLRWDLKHYPRHIDLLYIFQDCVRVALACQCLLDINMKENAFLKIIICTGVCLTSLRFVGPTSWQHNYHSLTIIINIVVGLMESKSYLILKLTYKQILISCYCPILNNYNTMLIFALLMR